ncbi:hypothetical protein X759_08320 [Mesorhizobium sp. LSHC420B00]|nr:hypothetical protein X759_08320 [Mesorhizobium sp. LSHC420B00]
MLPASTKRPLSIATTYSAVTGWPTERASGLIRAVQERLCQAAPFGSYPDCGSPPAQPRHDTQPNEKLDGADDFGDACFALAA